MANICRFIEIGKPKNELTHLRNYEQKIELLMFIGLLNYSIHKGLNHIN